MSPNDVVDRLIEDLNAHLRELEERAQQIAAANAGIDSPPQE